MLPLQVTALALVVFYVLFRIIDQPEPRRFLARFALVSVACWMAEESCILLYKFYSYSPSWSLFLGKVPLLIILIWPVIIHSAWDLASQLLHPGHKFVPLVAGAIVCTDAALLEPVAVNAGLWSWAKPGIFHVPPIGILGWGYFAFCCTLMLHWTMRPNPSKGGTLLRLLATVVGTHLLLLTSWWGALRYASRFDINMFAVGIAWVLSLVLVYRILRRGTGRRIQRKTLLLRLPAALFVFLLLALNVGGPSLLVIYALGFIPPYLTMMGQQYYGFSN
jgi:hypothetical protein